MTKYNVGIYGTGVKYGPSQQAEYMVGPGGFTSQPNLSATGNGNYIISWSPPGGNFIGFRLVRNFQNTPADENDGDILTSVNSGIHYENNLPQGSFVYYSIFVQDPTGEWFRAGDLTILVTRDWGYSDRLFELLPQFIQARDEALINPHDPLIAENPEMATKGPLRRFLQLPGWELDTIRTEYETLRLANDTRYVAGGLLPLLAKSVGLEYEAELGMRRNRAYIENAIHYYKIKGTQPGIEGIVSAVSGWDADITVGKNLMLDTRDATFTLGLNGALVAPFGTWSVQGGAATFALTDETTEGFLSAISGFDTQFLKVSAITGGPLVLRAGLIPIKGLTDVTLSAYLRSDTAALAQTLELQFFDKHLQPVVSSAGTAFTSTTGWVRREHTEPVPVGAFFARPVVSLATGGVHFLDFLQAESGVVATAYEHPRTIHIKLRANRINKVQNPSGELSLYGWTALTNCTLNRSNALQKSGAYSFTMTSLAPGDMEVGSALMPVTEGLRYALSAYFRSATATVQLTGVSIVWVAANGITVIGMAQSQEELEVTTLDPEGDEEFVRPGVVGLAPTGAAFAYVLVRVASTDTIGEVHHFDAVLFEQAESVKEYFDASQISTTGEFLWENGGSAHTVPSHFYSKRLIKRARLLQVLPDYLPASASSTLEFAKNP